MSTQHHFISLPPGDSRLSTIISHYYFHWSEAAHDSQQFVYYPHYKNALTSYWRSSIQFDNHQSHVLPAANEGVVSLYAQIQAHPITVSLRGPFYKSGIVFNPLGVNHFFNGSLSDTFPNKVSRCQLLGAAWEQLLPMLWQKSVEERIPILDAFLVQRCIDRDFGGYPAVLQRILAQPADVTLKSTATQLHASTKTVSRWFQQHLGCSFSAYKKVARFRLALENFHHKNPRNLTELAFLSQFYDQPDFNRNLKAMSGEHPKKLLNSLEDLGQDIFWTFV